MRTYRRKSKMEARSLNLLWLLLLTACVCVAQEVTEKETQSSDCAKCDPEKCAKAEGCLAGVVLDECDCCYVCARKEGEKCDNLTLALPYKHKYGICGENMVCQIRSDLKKWEAAEALCVCMEQQTVCGSDGETYPTICRLQEEAQAKYQLADGDSMLQYWGPCRTAPWIISSPNDTRGVLRRNLALDCEAKGYPIPAIHWEFEGPDGKVTVLPSDDQFIAVQVRGGPEDFMITGWVQVMDLKASDLGTYKCVATNAEGTAQATARVMADLN